VPVPRGFDARWVILVDEAIAVVVHPIAHLEYGVLGHGVGVGGGAAGGEKEEKHKSLGGPAGTSGNIAGCGGKIAKMGAFVNR